MHIWGFVLYLWKHKKHKLTKKIFFRKYCSTSKKRLSLIVFLLLLYFFPSPYFAQIYVSDSSLLVIKEEAIISFANEDQPNLYITGGAVVKKGNDINIVAITTSAYNTSSEQEKLIDAEPKGEHSAEKAITKKKNPQPQKQPASKIKITDPYDDSQFTPTLKYWIAAAPTPNNHLQQGEYRHIAYSDFSTVKTQKQKIVFYDPSFVLSVYLRLFKVRPPPHC